MSRIFTPEDITHFHTKGYYIARSLFDAEEMRLLIEVAKADRDFDKAPQLHKDSSGMASKLRLKNFCEDDIYSAFVCAKRIVDNMELLIGDEVYHWHHKMMLKEPRIGGAWEWHQDYGYWYMNHCLYPDIASCAIAVDRAGKDNGCMQLISGSHLCGRIHHGMTGEQVGADMERVEALLKERELVYAEMNPGDALFFHSNTLHRSDQNRSEFPRWTLIGCYNAKRNNPYKQPSGHPSYHKLNKIEDDQVKPLAQKYWKAAIATAKP
ncbi:MAG: phytanoyl-CoA dioxygenase family protein [Verrucomicrobia bacterium]|nr:phytanoyl-CoA dioxygenase family protein [Verrucomicrobiota bacterium]